MKRQFTVAAVAVGLIAASATPALAHTYHRVKSGETLSAIASRYGHSVSAIAAVNDVSDPNLIIAGERLLVDDWGGGASGGATSTGATSAGAAGSSTCPVQGSVDVTDSFGDARGGHYHEGVDMMSGYGSPVVAVTSGTITYSEYDGSGGNMLFLSGDDGNEYWYMHNAENFVSTGSYVSAGEQIATVGDTGNASTPHLHFEYHPGGGAAVDPYSLLTSLC